MFGLPRAFSSRFSELSLRCRVTQLRYGYGIFPSVKKASRKNRMSKIELVYDRLRNISCPHDMEGGRQVFSGHMRASEVRKIPTNQNVREYLLDDEQKKRRMSYVHEAILETLKERPGLFSVLNGGVVITAGSIEHETPRLKESNSFLLSDASIINGSQTRGVISQFFKDRGDDLSVDPYVTFELIVTQDQALVAEISGTRNSQNEVQFLSIIGRRGHLNDLAKAMMDYDPAWKIQTSETAREDQIVDTSKLIQLLMAVSPPKLFARPFEKKDSYKLKTSCMRRFEEIWENAHDSSRPKSAEYAEHYQFFLDIAPHVWDEYISWKESDVFDQFTRGKDGKKFDFGPRSGGPQRHDVPDGLVIPVISAYAAFCEKIEGKWKMVPPVRFSRDKLAKQAASYFRDTARFDPSEMGRASGSYSTLTNAAELLL